MSSFACTASCCSAGSQLGGVARRWPARAPRRVKCRSGSAQTDDDVGGSLRTLEQMLEPAGGGATTPQGVGTAEQQQQQQQQQQPDESIVGWVGHWSDRPATPATGPLRQKGMAPGSSGDYLDHEKLTRDPNRLSVGASTSANAGGRLQLPECAPRASSALAATVAAVGAVSLTGLVPPLSMVSIELGLGADWQLLTASVQPGSAAEWAAAVAALATAGRYAERRLGTGLFAASFFLSGGTAWILYLLDSFVLPFPLEACGVWPPLLGCAASLAAATAANWRVLGEAGQRGVSLAAVAGMAAVPLSSLDSFDALAALLVVPLGALLGWAAGPKLVVQEELDIALGSMTISGNEDRVNVVVDHRTALSRWLPIAAYAGLLAWVLASAQAPLLEAAEQLEGLDDDQLQGLLESMLRALRSELASPETQQRLFEEAPEQWARNA